MADKINLKNVELSKEKTDYVENEIAKIIKSSAIRHFFTPKIYDASVHSQLEFKKLGISSITNKEWFVDDKETGTTYWDYKQLPWTYAISIEEGEENMAIQTILKAVLPQNKIKLTKKENDENKKTMSREKIDEFDKALEKALEKVPDADVIITNAYDSHKFYWMPKEKFEPPGRTLKRGADIMGEYVSESRKKIPIYLGRMIPKWNTLVTNTKNAGEFLIKKKNDKDLLVKVSIIEEAERERIKINLGLTDIDLDNRARVYIEEIILFKVDHNLSSVLIENVNPEKDV